VSTALRIEPEISVRKTGKSCFDLHKAENEPDFRHDGRKSVGQMMCLGAPIRSFRYCGRVTGLSGSYAAGRTLNDAGQKSASRTSSIDILEARFSTARRSSERLPTTSALLTTQSEPQINTASYRWLQGIHGDVSALAKDIGFKSQSH
jgi:hypothetical protein